MAVIRAMVQMENVSAKPEDRFVNSFWFVGDWSEAGRGSIAVALNEFYNEPPSGQTASIGSYLSNAVTRTAGQNRIKMYNMADPMPREPDDNAFNFDAAGVGSDCPNEVAACISFYSGRNLPRQRGRVYIGPLTTNALGQQDGGDVRLAGTFLAVLVGAAARLANDPDVGWATRSSVDDLAVGLVTAGWVDNAFDTQRRRGAQAAARTTFGS